MGYDNDNYLFKLGCVLAIVSIMPNIFWYFKYLYYKKGILEVKEKVKFCFDEEVLKRYDVVKTLLTDL